MKPKSLDPGSIFLTTELSDMPCSGTERTETNVQHVSALLLLNRIVKSYFHSCFSLTLHNIRNLVIAYCLSCCDYRRFKSRKVPRVYSVFSAKC